MLGGLVHGSPRKGSQSLLGLPILGTTRTVHSTISVPQRVFDKVQLHDSVKDRLYPPNLSSRLLNRQGIIWVEHESE